MPTFLLKTLLTSVLLTTAVLANMVLAVLGNSFSTAGLQSEKSPAAIQVPDLAQLVGSRR